jgi:hypothetical protein
VPLVRRWPLRASPLKGKARREGKPRDTPLR